MHDIDMKDEENNGYKSIFIRYSLNNTKKITKQIVWTYKIVLIFILSARI